MEDKIWQKQRILEEALKKRPLKLHCAVIFRWSKGIRIRMGKSSIRPEKRANPKMERKSR